MTIHRLINSKKHSIVKFYETDTTVLISSNKAEEEIVTLDKLHAFRFLTSLREKGYICYV